MKTTNRLRFYLQTFYLVIVAALPAAVHAQIADEVAIKQLLEKQTQGWNRGNMDEYMNGYWQSDSLMFIGKKGPKYGYTTTLESFKKSYPDTAAMGKLHFNLLQIKRLSFEYYYVTGKWNLQRSMGNVDGYFTLLFRKINNKWLIISDHSS
jgi:hypothetical protein